MTFVHADSEALRTFASRLRGFNGELGNLSTSIGGQVNELAQSWQDPEFDKFALELEQALAGMRKYVMEADRYCWSLEVKAMHLDNFRGH